MSRFVLIFLLCLPIMGFVVKHIPATTGGHLGVSGQVIRHSDFASRFVVSRHLDVWLPPSYGKAPQKRYPVLYMHDGENLFDPRLSKYSKMDWGIDEAMTSLIEQGAVREAIVVGMFSTDARYREYMPQKAVAESHYDPIVREPISRQDLLSDAYLRFVVEEVKPFIDKTYRTLPDRDNTFMMGSSMGGLISLYALSEYPSIFGAVACVSTHFPAGDGVVIDYIASRLPSSGVHRLYFDFGTETLDSLYEPFQNRMDSAMRDAGYIFGKNWISYKFEGHDHSEHSWRSRVSIPLKFLLGR